MYVSGAKLEHLLSNWDRNKQNTKVYDETDSKVFLEAMKVCTLIPR